MSIIVSGFNGFEQFKCVCTFLKDRNYNKSIHGNANLNCGTDNSVLNLVFNSFPINFNTTFAASWSYCLSYHGDTLWLFGYVGRKLNCIKNVKLPKGEKINQVSCSRRHILCVTETGTCWQYSLETDQLKDLSGILTTELQREDAIREFVVKVSCGETITAVLTDKESRGKVSVQAIPQVVDWPDQSEIHVSKVACGARHTVTLLDDGSVWGCGWNGYNQLALAEVDSVDQMTRLPVDGSVRHIVCGPWSTCFIT
uniref:RCC1 domain-containing protein 1 n=1 Tax=Homalodisca liturata TaxID=320908 RepID=A0A1B6JX29_9HEMI